MAGVAVLFGFFCDFLGIYSIVSYLIDMNKAGAETVKSRHPAWVDGFLEA